MPAPKQTTNVSHGWSRLWVAFVNTRDFKSPHGARRCRSGPLRSVQAAACFDSVFSGICIFC
jgi:hypothetical protein